MEILILSNEDQDRNLFISCLSADKSSFTFCPSEAKRGEYSAALRRYQEAKPPLDTSRQAARRIHFNICCPMSQSREGTQRASASYGINLSHVNSL